MDNRLAILIVDDEADIRIFVHAVLSSEFPCTFFEAENAAMAIELLKTQKIDLVICDYNMPNGNGHLVLNEVLKLNPSPRFILFTGDDEEMHKELVSKPGCRFLQKPFRFKEIADITSEILNIIPVVKDNDSFTPLSATALLEYETLPFDVFIRLGSSHRIKYLSGNRTFSESDRERLKKIKTDIVYVDSQTLQTHFAHKERVIFQSLILPRKEVNHSFELNSVKTEINRMGLKKIIDDQELSELTQKNLKTVFALSFKAKPLHGWIDWVQSNEVNVKKLHTVLITLFCNIILKNLKSSSYDFKTYLYFAYAAVLHDTSLDDFYIRNESRITNAIKIKSQISKEEQDVLLNHVDKSLKIANEWSHCPHEVLTIIEHHHEKPNGTGFPKKITGDKIDKLSAIFIVAHDTASLLGDYKLGDDLKIHLDKLQEEYKGFPHFEEPFQIIKKELQRI